MKRFFVFGLLLLFVFSICSEVSAQDTEKELKKLIEKLKSSKDTEEKKEIIAKIRSLMAGLPPAERKRLFKKYFMRAKKKESEKKSKPYVGLKVYFKEGKGIVVEETKDDSPAEKANMKKGDVITHFDGKKLKNLKHLLEIVFSKKPGDVVTVTVLRNGKVINLKLTIGGTGKKVKKKPEKVDKKIKEIEKKIEALLKGIENKSWEERVEIIKKLRELATKLPFKMRMKLYKKYAKYFTKPKKSKKEEMSGEFKDKMKKYILKMIELNKKMIKQFQKNIEDLEEVLKSLDKKPRVKKKGKKPFLGIYYELAWEGKGLLIVGVYPNSPAQKAGLKKGDILRKIDGKNINSLKRFLSILKSKHTGDWIKFQVERDGRKFSLRVRLGTK